MGRTLKQAKRMQEGGRQAPPSADRGRDLVTTSGRDRGNTVDDASNTSGDRRAEEVTHDGRGQADRQPEERDENAGTIGTAAGGADERRRNRNSPEDANKHAPRTSMPLQTEVDEDDYFTAREESGTEATTARARREKSEEPSVASPIKPRRLHTREQ